MNRTGALVWKSRRDVQWIVACALCAILGPSWAEAISDKSEPNMAAQMSALFGPLAAILIGVALTCRDLGEPLVTFWSSRPINAARFVFAKFVVGIIAMFCVTALPSLGELPLARRAVFRSYVFVSQFPLQLLLFACSFAIGCVVRRAVPAALLSVAAGLLIYFGPILMPGLGFLDPWQWTTSTLPFVASTQDALIDWHANAAREDGPFLHVNPRFLLFLAAQAALIIALLAVSVVAVRHNVKWEAGQRAIAWSLALVALLLFWGASRDLGTSLPLQRAIPFAEFVGVNNHNTVKLAAAAGIRDGKGLLAISIDSGQFMIRHFDEASSPSISQDGFLNSLGPDVSWDSYDTAYPLVWPAARPDRAITIAARFESLPNQQDGEGWRTRARRSSIALMTIDVTKLGGQAESGRLDLSPWFGGRESVFTGTSRGLRLRLCLPTLCVQGNRLIAIGDNSDGNRTAEVFDISNPDAPKHVATLAASLFSLWFQQWTDEAAIPLPDIPGLTSRQVLDTLLTLNQDQGQGPMAVEGDLLAVWWQGELILYRLLNADNPTLKDKSRTILARRIGSAAPSLLGRVTCKGFAQLAMADGIVFGYGTVGMSQGVEAWDIRDPARIRSLGCYNMPREHGSGGLAPLPNHRLLVGGSQIHIVGPVVKGDGKDE